MKYLETIASGKDVRNSVTSLQEKEKNDEEWEREVEQEQGGVAVVKVTQHLCQKQLQSSSLSCSFIITHKRTHSQRYTRTHTDAHSNTHATASAWKSFHFFPFYLTGLPEKLVEQIFMKILWSSFIFFSFYALYLFLCTNNHKSHVQHYFWFVACCPHYTPPARPLVTAITPLQ